MKNAIFTFALLGMLSAQPVSAESWFDSLKSWLGLGPSEVQETASKPTMNGLLDYLTENLGITEEQARGGMASLLQFAQQNISPETFNTLKTQIPGLESILNYAPDISQLSQSGIGGLLDKAAEYSESFANINNLNKQFEALGLTPEMIAGFIEQARAYLDTEQGQEAKKILTDSMTVLST